MKRHLLNVFLVTVGAAIGSAVTWKIVKTKYEQIAQEEIDSVKEEYRILTQKAKDESAANEEVEEKIDLFEDVESHEDIFQPDSDTVFEYHKLTSSYRSSEDIEEEEPEEEGGMGDSDEVPYINGPYVISPDDFRCSPPGYNAQALDYFADGVLADSWGVKMDIDSTIGEDSLAHFGEYADGILYVRNERKEMDYEITQDPRTYDETVRTNPNPYYGQ